MKTNISIDISPPSPYLSKFWFSSYGPECCWPMNLQDSLECNISRKKWKMKFIFGMQVNIEAFIKSILSFWVCVARYVQNTHHKKFSFLCNIFRKTWGWSWSPDKQKYFLQVNSILWVCEAKHVQSTRNNKFAISSHYLKKNVKDEVDFLPTDKHQRFLQVDFIILSVCDQTCPNYRKITSLLFLCSILRKKWVMKVSYILMLWFLMEMVKQSRSFQNSKFAMSWQYLKKKSEMKLIFLHEDKHQSFPQVNFKTLGIKFSHKVILSLLMGMTKDQAFSKYSK